MGGLGLELQLWLGYNTNADCNLFAVLHITVPTKQHHKVKQPLDQVII